MERKLKIEKKSPRQFEEKISLMSEDKKVFLTNYNYDKIEIECFLSQIQVEDKIKTLGYSIKKNENNIPELVSVFSVEDERDLSLTINNINKSDLFFERDNGEKYSLILDEIVKSSIVNGAKQLDCLGDFLEKHYKEYFETIEKWDFESEYIEIEDLNILKKTFKGTYNKDDEIVNEDWNTAKSNSLFRNKLDKLLSSNYLRIMKLKSNYNSLINDINNKEIEKIDLSKVNNQKNIKKEETKSLLNIK